MKILFICKHNRFRSKVAEALFKKYNKNKKIKADSAGISPDYLLVAKTLVKALKEFGVNKVNKYPKKAIKKLINDSDLIVIVADNVSRKFFDGYRKKVIIWKISDTIQDDYEGILKRIRLIKRKIKYLIKSLK